MATQRERVYRIINTFQKIKERAEEMRKAVTAGPQKQVTKSSSVASSSGTVSRGGETVSSSVPVYSSPVSPPANSPLVNQEKDFYGVPIGLQPKKGVEPTVSQVGVTTGPLPNPVENVTTRKTRIAGSPENYDTYLNIVRTHPELAALHLFAGPLNIDLALASGQRGITGASEREEILIEQLHAWKGSPTGGASLERGFYAVVNNPFVQIAGSEAAGVVLGKVVGSISARIVAKYGLNAVKWFNRGQLVAGGVIAAPQVIDMGETAQRGEWNKFAGKSLMFGFTFTAGMKGYTEGGAAPNLWGKYKGLNSYQASISKTINKRSFIPGRTFFNNPLAKDITVLKNDFNPTRIQMTNAKYSMTQDMYTNRFNPRFPDTKLTNVEALNKLEPALKKGLTNTILGMTRKRGVMGKGGAFSPKDSTHDVDIDFSSGKEPVILKDISKRLGISENEGVVDTHKIIRVGGRTEVLGATAKPSDITESGVHRINVLDQFDRISEGAVFSPAKRGDKDIVNSINLIKKIYAKQYPKGIPEKSALKLKNFEEVYTRAGKTKDFIITESSEKQIYNPGKVWEYQQKFYEKTLSESYLKKKFVEYTKYPKEYLEGGFGKKPYEPIKRLISSLPDVPPSVSPGLRSPSVGFSFSNMFSFRSSGGSKSSDKGGSSSSGNTPYSSPSKSSSSRKSPSPYSPPYSPPSPPPYSPPSKSPPSSTPPSSPPYSPPPYSPPPYSPPFKSPPPSKSSSSRKSPSPSEPPYYPIIYPSPSMSGRGSRGAGWKIRQQEYKFRKAKIGLPFDLVNEKAIRIKL